MVDYLPGTQEPWDVGRDMRFDSLLNCRPGSHRVAVLVTAVAHQSPSFGWVYRGHELTSAADHTAAGGQGAGQ